MSADRMGDKQRLRLVIRGAVQGVGFRPFIYRLAARLGLTGFIRNTLQGVAIEVEGSPVHLETFLLAVEDEKPPLAFIQSLEPSCLDPVGYENFSILTSDGSGNKGAVVLPDIATCPACLREILTPGERRYRYPFTNCTNCGPRFTIIENLPYDRLHTSMKGFALCPDCRSEYDNPLDRRFHAQPIACPVCGPFLELWDEGGAVLASHDDALSATTSALKRGEIVALKGLGGFQLLVDARNGTAVRRLRDRKQRDEKPFALLYPSLKLVARDCEVSSLEARLLTSPEAPILLLRASGTGDVADSVAPGNPYLGVMLPSTPLHHLLMAELGFPVVATSGNLSDEPMCIDERDALKRLGGIADFFLVHNRPIVRHADDSIVRIVMGREMVLRRARGYAPLPVTMTNTGPALMALGGNMKNTVAFTSTCGAIISQHIGDLDTLPADTAFRQVINDFQRLHSLQPQAVVCDLHPDYHSTACADTCNLPVIPVQHHLAHVMSCMAENELEGPVLGVAWDGTGYGRDGLIWGSEFLLVGEEGVSRFAHLRPFPLPGGDRAVREPRRTALGILFALSGGEAYPGNADQLLDFTSEELNILRTMMQRGVQAPCTTSMGRLFDGIAALTGLCRCSSFEGQAAMALEFALKEIKSDSAYPLPLARCSGPIQLDWGPSVENVLYDLRQGEARAVISVKFHNALVSGLLAVAGCANVERVVLTGGCFQNKYLTERAVTLLRAAGFRPYWHQRVPPNDGGLSLGQLAAASRRKEWRDVSGNPR